MKLPKCGSARQKRMAYVRKLVSRVGQCRRRLRTSLLKPIKLQRAREWQRSVQLERVAADPHPTNDSYRAKLLSGIDTVRSLPLWAGSTTDSDSDPYRLRRLHDRNGDAEYSGNYSFHLNGGRHHDVDVLREVVRSKRTDYNLLASDDDVRGSSEDSSDDEEPFYSSFEVSQDHSPVNNTSMSDEVFVVNSDQELACNDDDGDPDCPAAVSSSSSMTVSDSESSKSGSKVSSGSADTPVLEKESDVISDISFDGVENNGNIDESTSWEDVTGCPETLEENQKFDKTCRWFEAGTKTHVLVLSHPTSLPVVGMLSARVIWGRLEVHGYVLSPKDGEVSLYSPKSHSHLVLQTRVAEGDDFTTVDDSSATLLACVPNRHMRQPIEAAVQDGTVGVLVRTLADRCCDYISRYFYVFNPRHAATYPITCLQKCATDGFYFPLPSLVNCLQESDSWPDILADIASYSQRTGEAPRILVTGGKNVGKSTLCRYTLNYLLNRIQKVLFMECDPAQSEFTPSGMMSLVEVSEPCFGPGYTHQKSSLLSVFLGATDVTDAPDHYKACSERIWDEYSQNDTLKALPLVVNTMGFNRGIGLSLLVNLIHLVRPTHIIQITSMYKGRNSQSFTYEYINSCQGWGMPFREVVFPYVHYHFQSARITEEKSFSPRLLRQINLLSYLSRFQTSERFKTLNQLPIYKVLWSSVGIHVCHRGVPNSHILHAINANVVALCHCDPEAMVALEDPFLPKFIPKLPVCEWLGYGIIRAVSMEEKCFYVISNLPDATLAKVNAFLKGDGDVEIPPSLLSEQIVDGSIPYLCSRRYPGTKLVLGNERMAGRVFKMGKTRFQTMFPR